MNRRFKFRCRNHVMKLMATAPSGKKFYMCIQCGYKTDWSPLGEYIDTLQPARNETDNNTP